jgi:hypothetical protein
MIEQSIALRKQQDVLDRVCEFTERLLCPQNAKVLPEPKVDMFYYASLPSISNTTASSSRGRTEKLDIAMSSEGDVVDVFFEQAESLICTKDVPRERVQHITMESTTTPPQLQQQQQKKEREKPHPVRETHLHYRPEKRKLSVYRM